jgi:hypothetical protein
MITQPELGEYLQGKPLQDKFVYLGILRSREEQSISFMI